MELPKYLLVATAFVIASSLFVARPSFAQSADISIVDYSSYKDSIGFLHVIGEVKNISQTPLGFVKITATFYDSSKTVVATDFGYTSISTVRPSEKAPFEVMVTDAGQIAKIDTFKLTASANIAEAKPASLKLNVGDHFIDSIGYYHLVGEVTNQGSTTANFVQVAAAFYDSSGKIVAAHSTFTQDTNISAGQTAPFDMIILQPGLNIASSSVNVQSNEYSMINDQLPTIPATSTSQPVQQTPTSTQTTTPTQQSQIKSGIDTTSLSPITFTDIQDNAVTSLSTGSMVLVSTNVKNSNPISQPFVIMVETRDSNGATVNLQFQKGTLNPNGSADVGISWTPQEKGAYQIRTFVVGSLKDPEVLSPLITKTVVVS
jgi:hypothetical protein